MQFIYLTLVTAGVLELDGRYLQRPVAGVAPRDGQAIVVGICPVADRQQVDTVFRVLHPRNLGEFPSVQINKKKK